MKRSALFLGSFVAAGVVALLLATVAPAHAIRACAECVDGGGAVGSGPFSCAEHEARLCQNAGGIVAGTFKCPCRAGDEVEICHIPPGNPDNAHTISVSEKAAAKHIENHGDTLGPCDDGLPEFCGDDPNNFPTCDGECPTGSDCQALVIGICVCQDSPPPSNGSCEDRPCEFDSDASCQCDAGCVDLVDEDCCDDVCVFCSDLPGCEQ